MLTAAKKAGVSRMTIYRWLKEPFFREAFRTQNENRLLDVLLHLRCSSSKAADLLVNIARNTKLPASSRVSACRAIIEMCLKNTKFDDVLKRDGVLEDLENI
jgi:predicted transcriptional regulator